MEDYQATNQSQTFASLFEPTERTFRIPEYQRAYSWEKTQIDQFLTDLREAQNSYYLGHYLFEHPENGKKSELLVVDGQQRLTTCILFFSVLCRRLITHNQKSNFTLEGQTWHNLFLRSAATNYQPKFTTVNYDDHFFQNLLRGRDAELLRPEENLETKSQSLLRKAYLAFEQAMHNASTDELLNWGRLVANATVTHLIVPDKKRAAQLFAFQNDRGKPLTALETIKSYFMLQILLFGKGEENPESLLPELEADFARIYHRLTKTDLSEDEVLTYFWRSTLPNPYGGEPVVDSIKKVVGQKVPPEQRSAWVKNFVEKLACAFEHVEEIENDSYEFAKDLRTLNNMALAYPLLLRAYRDGITKPVKERLFRFLENITFRYKLRGGRAIIHDRFNDCFFGNNQLPLSDSILNERIDTFVQRLRESWNWYSYWNDREMLNVLNGYFYTNPVDNYLLWKYERFLSENDNPFAMPYAQVLSQESIEHIAPQNPREASTDNPNWQNGYGDYHNSIEPTEGIESGEWLNRLGNLMLLSQRQNSRASNRPFAEKLAFYKRAGQLKQQQFIEDFLATDPVDANTRLIIWDKTAIENRHKHIVAAAQAMWSLANI